jgi:hypothetical protein
MKCVTCHRSNLLKWKANHASRWAAIQKKSRDKPESKVWIKKYNKRYYKNVAKPKRESEALCVQ